MINDYFQNIGCENTNWDCWLCCYRWDCKTGRDELQLNAPINEMKKIESKGKFCGNYRNMEAYVKSLLNT